MDDRKQLHALVDSLPEGALDSAEKFLQTIQTWAPKRPEMPPHVEEFRKRHEQQREQYRNQLMEKRDKFRSGCGGSGGSSVWG